MTSVLEQPAATAVRTAKRVLMVIGSMTLGGAENQAAMLAERLARRGWSVAVLALDAAGSLADRLRAGGVAVVDGGYRSAVSRPRKVLNLIRAQWRLFSLILRSRPDVVHCFLPLGNFMGSIAARLGCVPRIVTSKRGLATHQDRRPRLRWMDHVANRSSHVVTANSRAVADDTAARDHYNVARITIIPNGLDFPSLPDRGASRSAARTDLHLAPGDVAVAMVANLIAYKGHKDLIEAFAKVAADRPNLRLFLIGEDRGLQPGLEQCARNLGVGPALAFLGQRDDVPRLLTGMDIGVLSSHEEGMSNALLEKLAAGLPVVATAVGGNPEVLEGMPGCRLVRPADPADLARGLAAVVDGLATDAGNGPVRRQVVRERYSADAMVDAYERLYLAHEHGLS